MKKIIVLLLLVACGKEPGKEMGKEPGEAGAAQIGKVNEPEAIPPVVKSADEAEKFVEITKESPADIPVEQPPVEEMVNVACKFKNGCQTVCINTYISCVEPCGGQNVTYKQMQNPAIAKCQDDCNRAQLQCFEKPVQVTRAEYSTMFPE